MSSFDQSQGDGSITQVENGDGTFSFKAVSAADAVARATATAAATSAGLKLPLAGGTMTGPIDFATPDSNGLLIKSAASNWHNGIPLTIGALDFDEGVLGFDAALKIGWNLGMAGGVAVAGKLGIGVSFEQNAPRNGDPTKGQAEWHALLFAGDGTEHRFITALLFDDDTYQDLALGGDAVVLNDKSGNPVWTSTLSGVTTGNRLLKGLADQYLFADKVGGASILEVYGSAIGSNRQVLTHTDELYHKSWAGVEMLTLWGPDSGASRIMAYRGTALQSGGQTDYGLRFSSQSQFGVYVGTGVPTLSANYGALYLDGSSAGAGRLYTNVNNSTGWGQLQNTHATTGITASTTQTQGNGQLTDWINDVTICANDNDTVTLSAIAVRPIQTVLNNSAKILQVFPASGEDLGAGANTSTTIAAGAAKQFIAYTATKLKPTTL